jgi:phosphinothricin acetyltransferase
MPPIEYRIATLADARAIADIYAPYVRHTAITFEIVAPDADEIGERIARIGAQYPWLAAWSGGELIGYAYACENRTRAAYRWSVDAAVYLHASAHRRGAGHGLYRRLFALLREQGYVNAFAGITLPNAASVGLHEAMGFTLIGVHRKVGYKLGGWQNVGWWQLALREPPDDPIEPIAFPLLDAAAVAAMLAEGGTVAFSR